MPSTTMQLNSMPSTTMPGVPGLMLFSRGLQVSTTTGPSTTAGAPGAATTSS